MTIILRGQMLNGTTIEFKPEGVEGFMSCVPDEVVYVRYNGASYPLKAETVELIYK